VPSATQRHHQDRADVEAGQVRPDRRPDDRAQAFPVDVVADHRRPGPAHLAGEPLIRALPERRQQLTQRLGQLRVGLVHRRAVEDPLIVGQPDQTAVTDQGRGGPHGAVQDRIEIGGRHGQRRRQISQQPGPFLDPQARHLCTSSGAQHGEDADHPVRSRSPRGACRC
jgi:hypothetical protein